MTISRELIDHWKEAKERLDSAKEDEMNLRILIASEVAELGAGGDYLPGTFHHKDLGEDIVVSISMNQKIDKKILSGILADLSDEEKAAIRYKPELNAKEYKLLPADSLLNKAIKSKPSTPTLEIKELKE